MAGRSRRRGLGARNNENATVRWEAGQLLRATESFDFIDDVTWELRSLQGFRGQVNARALRPILERLDKSDTLVRRPQGQDVAAQPAQRSILMEGIAELRRLIDQYVGKANKAKFEAQLRKIVADDRLARRQTNHRENANAVPETVDIPQRPLQREQHSAQAFQRLVEVEDRVVVSRPNIANLFAGGDGFSSSATVMEQPFELLACGDGFLSSSFFTEQPFENEAPVYMETNAVETTVLPTARRGYGDMWSPTISEESMESQSSTSNEDSNSELENVSSARPQEPLQQERHISQASEQSAAAVEEIELAVDSMPDTQNIFSSGNVFSSSSAVTEESPEVSNELKNAAQMNFNAELLKKLHVFCQVWGSTIDIEEVCDMVKQRTTLIEHEQYEYSLADQHQFNQALLTKLRVFEQTSLATFGILNVNIMFQELIDMLQADDLNPDQFRCPFARYLTDFDLLKYIASDSDSVAAKRILRARKLRLKRLSFEWQSGSVLLKLSDSLMGDNSAGITDPACRTFQYGTVNNVDAVHVFGLFDVMLKVYDVSKASISLRSDGSSSSISTDLWWTFGSSPTDQNSKRRVEDIIILSPGMTDFLRWFCPIRVVICCDSDAEVFINEPSLITGVTVIELRSSTGIGSGSDLCRADRFLESHCAPGTIVRGSYIWSQASICRVLTTHMLSAYSGCPRTISYQCNEARTDIRSFERWKEIFETWSRVFEGKHGKIGQKVTLSFDGIHHAVLLSLS